MRHHLTGAALALVVFSVAAISRGEDTAAVSRKHPVAQLVEWELTANSEIKPDSLRRMANVVLERSDPSDFPAAVLQKLSNKTPPLELGAFRASSAEQRRALLEALDASTLKALVQVPVPMEYLEIPEEQLAKVSNGASAHSLPGMGAEKGADFVRFEKDGKPHIRWFLHPLADKNSLGIVQIMKSVSGRQSPLPLKRGDIKGHFTSSRSMILFRGGYESAVSVKLGLPSAEGPFPNKSISMKQFSAWTRLNRYLADTTRDATLSSSKLLYEPFGLGVDRNGIQDGMLFRSLDDLSSERRYYLPAFSILNEGVGAAIAKMNGSDNPLKFWEEHLLNPLADGMAELRAYTGAEHTSMHSQNLLVELDQQMKPTGKVVLRDFDFYIDSPAFRRLNRVVEDADGLTRVFQYHYFLLRSGLYTLPSWMSDGDYSAWIEKYFNRFGDRFSEITRIPRNSVNTQPHAPVMGIWAPVAGGNFTTGGRNNLHAIPVQGIGFNSGYDAWLKQRAPFAPVKPSSSAVQPHAPARTEPPRRPAVAAPETPRRSASAECLARALSWLSDPEVLFVGGGAGVGGAALSYWGYQANQEREVRERFEKKMLDSRKTLSDALSPDVIVRSLSEGDRFYQENARKMDQERDSQSLWDHPRARPSAFLELNPGFEQCREYLDAAKSARRLSSDFVPVLLRMAELSRNRSDVNVTSDFLREPAFEPATLQVSQKFRREIF